MFYFVENMPEPTASVRSVCINHTINGMDELFELFKKKLEFPYPYSTEYRYNYNAFHEIMMELYWVPEKEVRIIHDGLPSLDEEIMGHHYLDVLNLIDVEWERFTERANITKQYAEKHPGSVLSFEGALPWWEKRPKEFSVYFRKQDEVLVKGLLSKCSWDYRKCIHFDETGRMEIDYKEHYPYSSSSF